MVIYSWLYIHVYSWLYIHDAMKCFMFSKYLVCDVTCCSMIINSLILFKNCTLLDSNEYIYQIHIPSVMLNDVAVCKYTTKIVKLFMSCSLYVESQDLNLMIHCQMSENL